MMLKMTVSRILLLIALVLSASPSIAADWWNMSDADFVTQYGKLATGTQIEQSQFAWMLFLRVNQQVVYSGDNKNYSQWELWPSNLDTFSPNAPPFKLGNKFRTRPHLQDSKSLRIKLLRAAASPKKALEDPNPSPGEEVTRNMTSYHYIMENKLNTQAGITGYWMQGKTIDFDLGSVETKAFWQNGAIDGAYQVAGLSLTGLHLMIKIAPTPKQPFTDNTPSWFWTTFEFKGNPGLANAQSLLTYHDVLPAKQLTNLQTQSGLAGTPFVNYVSNGQQIQFDDAQHPAILLGNTKMEDFAASPGSNPANWKTWETSCHSCHGQASGIPNGNTVNFFDFTSDPFPTGPLQGASLPPAGSVSLDFVWSLTRAQ